MNSTLLAVFSPLLAAGAAGVALGVPLVIHLLFRKRYQIVPWAAMRFLLVAERRHKRRIDQWLLLALRTFTLLLILFAVIASTEWAEKAWQSIRPGTTETLANVPRTHHVIVLDGSLSMTAKTEDGQTRFEASITHAENLIRSASPGDGFTVLLLTSKLHVIVPGPSNDPERVIAELRKEENGIKRVRATHASADHAVALSRIADILTRSPRVYPRRQLTFFSDLQRSSWAYAIPRPENSTAELWQRITARADVAIVDSGHADLDNLAIAELVLSDPMPLVDQPLSVTVTVANLGRVERKRVRVELLLGRPSSGSDALVAVEQKPLDPLPPGTRGSVKFDLTGLHSIRERGVHFIQAKIVGEDDLPADDTRSIAIEVRDGIHVVLIEGKADPDPTRQAATHLYRALFPPGARQTDTPNRPSKPISPDKFLDPNLSDLTGVDCVFVCDVFNPSPDLAVKLDTVLRRGGTVIFGLGPNAAASRDRYNEVLYRGGNGILPCSLGETVSAHGPDDSGFRLVADEEEYRRPPLLAFGGDRPRAGLVSVPFRTYLKLETAADRRAHSMLSFARAGSMDDPKATPGNRPDPALVESSRHRGKVFVFASTFNEEWNDWPSLLNYLPFWHEFLKYSVANPNRHTLNVGEPIEEFFPASTVGLNLGLTGPDGLTAQLPLRLQDEAGVAYFADTSISGLYRLGLSGARDRVFAVNVAEVMPGLPSESDLRRLDSTEFKAVGTVQVVHDPSDVKPTNESGAFITSKPKPHGPMLARWAIIAAVVLLAVELLLAWYLGPSRSGVATGRPESGKRAIRLLGTVATLLLVSVAGFILFAVLHADRTGDPLGFLDHDTRSAIEKTAGVPTAAPGEGTKWRLEGFTAFFRNAVTDRRVVIAVAVLCLSLTVGFYWMERSAAGGLSRVAAPILLRSSTFLLVLFVLLGQLRLAFDREGWPEVVILLDTSASMETADDFKDPTVRAKAEELAGTTNLSEVNRLRLAQLLITNKKADWLEKLFHEKQVKVHIYAVDVETKMLTTVDEADQLEQGRNAIESLRPEGDGSRLGDGVEEVLKAFRGSPLAAIIMFTDGVNTSGDDLPKAARTASLDGVPLFLVGVGDTWERPDLALADLQVEDVIGRGDRLAFEVRLTARGEIPPGPVTVFLKEKLPNGELVDRAQATVSPSPNGSPETVTLAHTPMEIGEKTFILVVPTVPGETNTRNNQIERTVLVTDSRRIRVLYIEGYPRYDYRFVKVMLERESDKSLGGKSVELQVVLMDASKGWPETDRSAFRGEFPTRTELFGFDVVILGDVNPKEIGGTRSAAALRDLADFVKVKGGGMLFLSGMHGTPAAYADTPLAEILPVIPSDSTPPVRQQDEESLTEVYQPRLTPAGRLHPLFRFSADEAESARIWAQLQPLYWYATGYHRKPLTSVLAVHPSRPAEGGAPGENHPLVIQQFSGAGPVLFFGLDETWRWRFRNDEEHFDRFWLQAIRVLSRSRIRRPEVRVLPKTEFRRDEKVIIQVRFPIEAPAPGGDTGVRVSMNRSPLVNNDGTPGSGQPELSTLVLNRIPGPTVQFETTLARVPEGEYRFELLDPEVQGTQPWATARVLPPLNERERTEMNRSDMIAAAAYTGGGFYTLDTANDVFNDLKNLQRVPLNQPCEPVQIWNQPAVFALLIMLLMSEWLLRKRERLL